jgi:tetratricopeptide (TPR) repeat protein
MALKKTKPEPKAPGKKAEADEVQAAAGGSQGKAAAVDSRSGAAVAPRQVPEPSQLQLFEAGIRLFNRGEFREAHSLLARAAKGPDRGIAHRAQLHAAMCERRLERPVAVARSAEEHYNYGVALINSRELSAAREHLEAALAMEPNADHVYYALGLCHGLAGDLQGAYEHLKHAIDLQPRNRIAARQDADFAPLLNQSPLDRLLQPEKKSY